MTTNSKISWTDHTWNPWRGCKMVSSGCAKCYMFRDQQRYGNDPNLVVRSKTTFNDPLKWHEQAFVFTCSWSDFFIEEADQWRDDAWEIMFETPHLTYLVLTKRPELVAKRLPDNWRGGWDNVWIGTSIENQKAANVRLPLLLSIPAKRRFLSCEPLLGPVDLAMAYPHGYYCDVSDDGFPECRDHAFRTPGRKAMIDFVIVGGESGPHQATAKARSMNMAWARKLRDQCVLAGVPFWFKQDFDTQPGQRPYIVEEDGTHTEWFQRPEHIIKIEPEKKPEQLSMF